MSSAHLIDPSLADALAFFPSFTLKTDDMPRIRETLEQTLGGALETHPKVKVETINITGEPGSPDIGLVIYRPLDAEGPLPAILHMHPGGYVIGSPAIRAGRNNEIAAEAGCVIVSVSYRRAPETLFPGALEDGYAGLKWLFHNAGKLGVDPARIVIMGESAGGGLAAVLAQYAHDKGEVPIMFQLLIYPMLDSRSSTSLDRGAFAGEFVWTPEMNRFAWNAYLGEGLAAANQPFADATSRTDLSGLPPAFVAVGSLDLFVEEDIEYATRLMRAGVATELHVYPGAFHGSDMVPTSWTTDSLNRDAMDALKRAITPKA